MAACKSTRVHRKYKTKYRVTNWPEYERAGTRDSSAVSFPELPPRSRIGAGVRARRTARYRGSARRPPPAESGRRRFVSAIS